MRACFLAVVLLALAGIVTAMQAPAVTVIMGGTLINPAGDAIPNTVITLEGSRIKSVVQLTWGNASTGAGSGQVIDATGKFVIAGLADMHNHLEDGGISARARRLPCALS